MAGRGPQWIYATDRQRIYLRHLLHEAFAAHVEGYQIKQWDRLLKSEASTMISALRQRLGYSEEVQ